MKRSPRRCAGRLFRNGTFGERCADGLTAVGNFPKVLWEKALFQCGTAGVRSDHLSASAFCTTHFAAAAGGLAWAIYDWLTRGKPTVLGTASGIVAGLVCITPAAGFVNPMPAFIMGAAAGLICAFACSKIKSSFGYDDSLDAFGVHGVGGSLGAFLTGVFATRHVADPALVSGGGKPVGLVDGNSDLIFGQLAAIVVTWVLAAVATFIILKVLDATMGLRVSQDEELKGLDITQHGEEGYIFI